MANKEQLDILKKSVRVWNEWRQKERAKESEAWERYRDEYSDVIAESDGPYYYPDEPESITIDLNKADFSGADLAKVDFCGANLKDAKFNNAKLMGAEFLGAKLNNADFSFANLSYADFSGADLDNTKLDSAILVGTKFDNKDLSVIKGLSFNDEGIDENLQKHAKYSHRLKVFLCHSSDDKEFIRKLYRQLCAAGIDPWLDEEKILPGRECQIEIKEAVRSSDAVVVILSNNSISKKGFVQKEIRIALDVADEQPEGSIFLIPLKIEKCKVPKRLSHLQWVSLSDEKGFDKLMRSLRARASELEISI
jgi:hypothetical protein